MNLRITVKGLGDKAGLRAHAEERVGRTLGRFAGDIVGVTVLLEDVTGPRKHTVDKRCRIGVRMRAGGELMIDEMSDDILGSLALALERLKAAMSRKAGRSKRGVGAG